jgi:citrate lyase subunit beta/citryl-CoA lyase
MGVSQDPIRSVVFATAFPAAVPGGFAQPSLAAALDTPAVGVILDLEDTTAESEKARVRASLPDFGYVGERLWVRINSVESDCWRDDVAAAAPAAATLVVPKVESAEHLVQVAQALDRAGSSAQLVALVETARGLRSLHEICDDATGRLRTVLLGMGDLTRDMGVTYTGSGEVENYARARVVEATVAAGLAPPIDTAALVIGDEDFFRTEARLGKRMGFGGKCCLALDEVYMTHEEFDPTPGELAWARKAVEEYRQARADGRGILVVEGQLVDLPVARRCAALLRSVGVPADL